MTEQNNYQNTTSLAGKTVVVIGGSSGIGLATAKAATAEGAKVIIASGNAQRVENALKELPPSSYGYTIDVTNEKQVADLFNKLGNIDHLIFTAGEHLQVTAVNDVKVADAREFFNVRFWGAFTCVKYAAPRINTNGSIVLTGGLASHRPPGKGWSLVASVFAAVQGFTRSMAVELSPIRVNLVTPGFVKTNLWGDIAEPERENLYSAAGASLLTKRVGEAHELAQAFLYLMKQTYCTGQCIVVDGGGSLV